MKLFKSRAQGDDASRRDLLKMGGGLAVLAAGLSVAGTSQAQAAPAAVLWARWQANDPASAARIDHTVWGDFLSKHLVEASDGVNRLGYGRIATADKAGLDAYIDGLAALPISTYNRDEQMAYWVNLYNALTVQVVLDNFPVDSIRDIDISPGLFSDGPWGKKLLSIEGEQVSLDDIEHQILRPIWQDPRIHYAVNCASIGCPNLQAEPFEAAVLDEQLDRAAADFVNHRRGVSIENGRLIVSSIYSWFSDDFGSGSDRDVIAHLKRHATPELESRLGQLASIYDDRYDWRLNDADGATA